VSHISGAVELLNKDQSNLRENQKLEIKTIADLTEQADKMVHEMQEMSMVKSKETEVLNMVDVVSKMITIAKNSLDSRIEVLMDCIYESVHIKANCEKIETTILNLLINASEAIEGRGIISVHFESFKKDDNDFLKIKVIDNGKGMIQEELNRAFEPMYTSKEKNSGLGLNFVEQTINELSGEIYLESHEGKGTTVELILPVLELKETKINKKNSSNFSVVLVEEDDALRHLIERILTNMEVSFTSVTNGVEATRHIHKSPDPTLVVLDLDMKGLSGFDTYNLIKQLNPSQKFLLTSMDPHQEELQKIKQKGKVHLLGKPFSVETFELEVDFLFSYS
jgi:two-component system cell cycle sensor histidine kinase/response regulator CckA